ncbi:thyrotropin-releasing hormone receptor-like [Homalodisca vitripennis]|uniref:thyrotropin-releasing hormone receptor-like n=1 Tax=Homalodisca vitripennis TaxID=197043 RepID=UPI001EEBB494|nr:thyrotropin-releasing hormone receptor-like [Homalodisca vitripennis]
MEDCEDNLTIAMGWIEERDLWCNDSLYLINDSLRVPEFYSHRYRIVGTIFQGIVFLVGILGNLMVVVVVKRTRSMHSPTNCYLVSLAMADMVVLIASVPNEILSYYLVGNHWLWGDLGCSLFVFFQNLGINSSSLSLIAFTFERYMAICHPMKAHKVCTQRRAKKIIFSVWVLAVLYCSPWLFLTTTKPLNYRGFPQARFCDFKRPRDEYLPYYFTDLVVFYLVPLFVSCVLYGLIARTLLNRRVIRAAGKASSTVVLTEAASSSRSQVVKMLAMVVAVFATLWLPYRGLLVYNSFAILFSKPKYMDLWFLMFAKTCVFINSAINPILYNAMSTKFRRAFQKLLLCGEPVQSMNISNLQELSRGVSTRESVLQQKRRKAESFSTTTSL